MEISILPHLCAKKIYFEDAPDVTSFMLHSFQHIATIDDCMFHLIYSRLKKKAMKVQGEQKRNEDKVKGKSEGEKAHKGN